MPNHSPTPQRGGRTRRRAHQFTRRHEAAIVALLNSPTEKEAAARAQVGEATLRRWMRQPGFRDRYERERQELFTVAKTALLSNAREAVETLKAIHSNVTIRPGARVRAAEAILDLCVDVERTDSLIARLERLEGHGGRIIDGEVIE